MKRLCWEAGEAGAASWAPPGPPSLAGGGSAEGILGMEAAEGVSSRVSDTALGAQMETIYSKASEVDDISTRNQKEYQKYN